MGGGGGGWDGKGEGELRDVVAGFSAFGPHDTFLSKS